MILLRKLEEIQYIKKFPVSSKRPRNLWWCEYSCFSPSSDSTHLKLPLTTFLSEWPKNINNTKLTIKKFSQIGDTHSPENLSTFRWILPNQKYSHATSAQQKNVNMTLITNISFKSNLPSQIIKEISREPGDSFSTMTTGKIGEMN